MPEFVGDGILHHEFRPGCYSDVAGEIPIIGKIAWLDDLKTRCIHFVILPIRYSVQPKLMVDLLSFFSSQAFLVCSLVKRISSNDSLKSPGSDLACVATARPMILLHLAPSASWAQRAAVGFETI